MYRYSSPPILCGFWDENKNRIKSGDHIKSLLYPIALRARTLHVRGRYATSARRAAHAYSSGTEQSRVSVTVSVRHIFFIKFSIYVTAILLSGNNIDFICMVGCCVTVIFII